MTPAGGVLRDLRDALAPAVAAVRPPVDLHRVRVHRNEAVIVDVTVHGAPLSCVLVPPVPPADTGAWRVELEAERDVDEPQLARLGLERLGARRFLVGTVPGPGRGLDPPADRLVHCVRATLDALAALGPAEQTRRLLDAVGLEAPVVVVDVGANPLELPPYSRLLGLGRCLVVGFEPQPEAFARLPGSDPERALYLPHAVGEPGRQRLRVYRGSGFTSLFDIDEASVELVGDPRWREQTRLVETIELDLLALDDVPGLPAFDLLKIDVQGGELAVFRSGRRALADALCVIPEVSFFPLYRDAPTYGDLDRELVDQGFRLHKFLFTERVHLRGSQSDEPGLRGVRNQLIDGDAVYLRDLRGLADWTSDRVRRLVLLAALVFDSRDLAVLALDELVRRGEVDPALPAEVARSRYV